MMQGTRPRKFDLYRDSDENSIACIRKGIEITNDTRIESKLIAAIVSKLGGVSHFITNDDDPLREKGIEGVDLLEESFMTFENEESVFNELETIECERRNLELVLYKPRIDPDRQAVFLDTHCRYEYSALG